MEGFWTVIHGASAKGRDGFTDLGRAKEFAMETKRNQAVGQSEVPIAILNRSRVCIAVVTDDANGLTLHRLPGYPREDEEY
jgi:hypothetical protein